MAPHPIYLPPSLSLPHPETQPTPSSPTSNPPPQPKILPTHLTILLTILTTLVVLAVLITLYTLYQRNLYRRFARYYIWSTDRPVHPDGRWREIPRVNAGNAKFYGPGMDAGGGVKEGVEMKSLGVGGGGSEKFRCEDVKVRVPKGVYGGWRGGRR